MLNDSGPVSVELNAEAGVFSTHSGADHTTIPDAELLFQGDFKRAGEDLKIVGHDGKTFVVHDYFKTGHLQTLFAPDGAALSGDIVAALAGPRAPGQYAQAGGSPPASDAVPIGRVATVQGGAVAMRNGVAITLNVGDAVMKGDVVQTQGNSAVGVIFGDGTTFNLGANARMVLNEFVYNPAPGSANSAFINLVQGSITFIAGEVAKHGDMKVGTPVATMGIRGTAVQVDIDVNNGTTKLSVLIEPGGKVGSFNVFSLSGQLIGTVSDANGQWTVTPTGPLNAIATEVQKSPAEMQQALVAVQSAFQTQSIGQTILQQQPVPPSDQGPAQPQNLQGPDNQTPQNPTQNTPKTQIASSDVSTIKITVAATETDTGTTTTVVVNKPDDTSNSPTIVPPPAPPPPPPANLPPFFETAPTSLIRVAVTDHDGNPLNAIGPQASADGRFIAFLGASALPGSGGHDNGSQDVFIYDRLTGTAKSMTDVLVGTTLHEGESFGSLPSLSSDGHYVVFDGEYQKTVSVVGQGGESFDFTYKAKETFIYDSHTGITTLLTSNGGNPSITADGHYVAVEASIVATEQGEGNTSLEQNVVEIIDRTSGNIVDQIAMSSGDQQQSDPGIRSPSLNSDGRYLTFETTAASIDVSFGGDSTAHFDLSGNGKAQIYIYDLQHPGTPPQLVSFAAGGGAGNGNSGDLLVSDTPSVSMADNTAYTFSQNDFYYTDDQGNPQSVDIHIKSLPGAGTLFFNGAAVTAGQVAGPGLFVSADDIAQGQLTYAPPAGANGAELASFSFQAQSGQTTFDPQTMTINVGLDDDWPASMSADGRYVVFQSDATNLVAGGTDGHSNIYLFDAVNHTLKLISVDLTNTASAHGDSFRPEISADGRYVTYVSSASDLISGGADTNHQTDTFVYDRLTGSTTLVSNGYNGDSEWGTTISGDGTVVGFGSQATNTNTETSGDDGAVADIFVLDRAQLNTGSVVDNPALAGLTTTGTLKFTDAAPDTHAVSVAPGTHYGTLVPILQSDTGSGSEGVISWTYTVDEAIAAQLGGGKTLTDTFNVIVTDSVGGTSTAVVTVNIVGSNADISGTATGSVVENSNDLAGETASGQLAVTTAFAAGGAVVWSANNGDNFAVSGAQAASGGGGGSLSAAYGHYGHLTVDQHGNWQYVTDDNLPQTAALAPGQVVTDTFAVQAANASGGVETKIVTITVTGGDGALPDHDPVSVSDTVQAAPGGWSFDSANGHYYRYVAAAQITWSAANTAAVAAGGYLTTITNSSENAFVHTLAGAHVAWLGGSDAGQEGAWSWVTGPESGTSFYGGSAPGSAYSNWSTGEPNNLDHGNGSPHQENYLQILANGSWNDEQGPNLPSANVTDGYVEEMGVPGVILANFVEDTQTRISTAALLANDTDADGDTLVVSQVNGTSAHGGAVALLDGVITYTPSVNFNGADSFSYTVSDGHGGTTTGTLNFTVGAVNDAPVITSNGGGASATVFVAENSTAVTQVHATDVDGPALTYSLVTNSLSSPDAGKFTIDSITGVLSFRAAPDYEHPTDANHNNFYTVEVRVSGGTLTDTQTLHVDVTDVNEAPKITSNGGHSTASVFVAENRTAVTTVQAVDPDFGDHVHFSIVSGSDSPDAAKFTINSFTGQLSFLTAPDYEHPTDAGANNSYVVKVQASDGSLTDTQVITVDVTNVNEAPAITSDGGHSTASVNVAENTTAVTTVQAVDPDAGATLHYSLVQNAFSSPDAGKFAIDATTGALSFVTPPDYENPTDSNSNNNYVVQVRASDGLLSDTQTLNVHVTDVFENHAPQIAVDGSGVIDLPFDADGHSQADGPSGSVTLTLSDADGDAVNYVFDAGWTQVGAHLYSHAGDGGDGDAVLDTDTGVMTFTFADIDLTTERGDVSGRAADSVNVTVEDSHGAQTTQAVTFAANTVTITPDNLAQDGGFETGALWSNSFGDVADEEGSIHRGFWDATIGGGGQASEIAQDIATSPGEHYTLSFWLINSNDAPNDFTVSWGGHALSGGVLQNIAAQDDFIEYQFDVVGAAGATSTSLAFDVSDQSSAWQLDDVSVRQGTPDAVQQLASGTLADVQSGDAFTVTPTGGSHLGQLTTAADDGGGVDWNFTATNAEIAQLEGKSQTYLIQDQTNSSANQTLGISVGGEGNDQFFFFAHSGNHQMVNFSTQVDQSSSYYGDSITLNNFTSQGHALTLADVLADLTQDSHGNAVVNLGGGDSITFQHVSESIIQAQAGNLFHFSGTSAT